MNTSIRGLTLVLAAATATVAPAFAHAQTKSDFGSTPVIGQPIGLNVSGTVDQLRIDPHGRVSGVLLTDGTEIVASGPAASAISALIAPGDRIRTPVGPNATLEIESVRNGTGHFVSLGPIDFVARGGGPSAIGPVVPYARVDDASMLDGIAITGRVRNLLHAPNGVPTGFVMDNGAQIHVAPSVAGAVAQQIAPGEFIRVQGRGTQTPRGTGLWAVSITRPNNFVLLDMLRGIGAPELNLH